MGEWEASREILYDFWGYVFEAANSTEVNGVPSSFLAAVLYNEILSRPKDRWKISGQFIDRSLEIEFAAMDFNTPESFSFGNQIDNTLGVGQLKGETIAMLLGATPWREKPQDPKQRGPIDKSIKRDFENLPIETKIEIFNLLRFPKSNISLCAQLLTRLKNRPNRRPNLTQQQFLRDEAAIQIIATEYNIGAIDSPLEKAKSNKNGPKILRFMRAMYLSPYFREHTNYSANYRDLELQKNDTGPEVQALKNDLKELGFLLVVDDNPVAAPTDVFDLHTEWAVREFQIYSKMQFIARERAIVTPATPPTQRLRRHPNLYRYAGPVSGVVNAGTRRRIQAWKANRWRCPVMVSAWSIQNNARQAPPVRENIWLHDTLNNTQSRVFFQDYTDYYVIPDQQREGGFSAFGNGHIKLGEYFPSPGYGGPRSIPPIHTWEEAEILPENLTGRDLYIYGFPPPPPDAATQAQRSTFKVVRAVAEQECLGFFDSLNAWDNAFMSLGPCHWTLPIRFTNPATVEPGELCGYLSYLKKKDAYTYREVFQFFGADIDREWGVNGATLWIWDQRKYVAGLLVQQEDFTFAPLYVAADPIQDKQARLDYYRTWHWFYRFSMAGRVVTGFQRWMWRMARIRLCDIAEAPWPTGNNAPMVPLSDGTERRAQIKEVYTSERAMALLLRWHVRFPKKVFRPDSQGANSQPNLAGAFAQGQAIYQQTTGNQLTGDPNTWGQAEEDALIRGLATELTGMEVPVPHDPQLNDPDNYTFVFNWPFWETRDNNRRYRLAPARLDTWAENWVDRQGNAPIRRLSTAHKSFRFWDLQVDEL